MKTTRTIVATLLLVAAMLIGAIAVPATFAANDPAEPYDGEVYASTATTNAPLPEKVSILYLEDVVTPINEAYSFGSSWEGSSIVSVDAEAIWRLLIPSAVNYGDIEEPNAYDFSIVFFYSHYGDVKRIETFRISTKTNLVTFAIDYNYANGTHDTAYSKSFSVPEDTMQQIIACCEFKEESCVSTVELTDEIVGEITYLAQNAGFRVGRLTYDDIYNVVYQTENCYQSALQIAATLDGSSLSTEQVLTYVGLAMRAQTWQEMRENLVSAISCYATEVFVAAEASCNDSFASQLVSDSFYAHWYEQEDVMTIVHYALWMSVVAGGCY